MNTETRVQLLCSRLGLIYRRFGSNTFLVRGEIGTFVVWSDSKDIPCWCPINEFKQPILRERSVKL